VGCDQDVPFDVRSRTWQRNVTLTPLQGHEAAGLATLKVDPIDPTETPGGLPGASRPPTDDASYEKSYFVDEVAQ
jgi:hypothetical protein